MPVVVTHVAHETGGRFIAQFHVVVVVIVHQIGGHVGRVTERRHLKLHAGLRVMKIVSMLEVLIESSRRGFCRVDAWPWVMFDPGIEHPWKCTVGVASIDVLLRDVDAHRRRGCIDGLIFCLVLVVFFNFYDGNLHWDRLKETIGVTVKLPGYHLLGLVENGRRSDRLRHRPQ